MSNKKRKNQISEASSSHHLPIEKPVDVISVDHLKGRISREKKGIFVYLKNHLLAVGIIALLAFGAPGSALKYLDESAQTEIARRNASRNNLNYLSEQNKKAEESFLNKINPFLPAALPSPTPQLSKEYVYAGSRLLAVEDANANAAPPADLAVWRPSSGVWWIMGSSGSQQATQQWGMSGDVPVPGDYDGDGKTDFSVFRPNTNQWWIMRSSDNTAYSITFGATGDKAAQADYDGDGRTDQAIFRADQTSGLGTFYVLLSTSGQSFQQQFGLSTDMPAVADYDGDGRADLAVWRNSNNSFYSFNSSNGQLDSASFGAANDVPVSADYDGDGKADYALFRDSNATWYLRYSASPSTVQAIQWGTSGDKLVQNDYDGDGKVDVAVWHDANGQWTIRNSSNNSTRTVTWGISGDIPVPAFFRR